MLPEKIQIWLESKHSDFPRRVLLSGENALEHAVEIASILQNATPHNILSGIHSDTVVFQDNGKSFKIAYSDAAQKDGQSEHENARGLIKWLHRTPEKGNYRIAILEGLERLSRESPHALLKLIEEPPKDAFLIFTTRNHHQILETILSRVTVVRLPNITNTSKEFKTQAPDFISSKSIIERFKIIEELDKQTKKVKEKTLFKTFSQEIIEILRTHPTLKNKLPEAFELSLAIKRNQNPRFCLEHFALSLSTKNS